MVRFSTEAKLNIALALNFLPLLNIKLIIN